MSFENILLENNYLLHRIEIGAKALKR